MARHERIAPQGHQSQISGTRLSAAQAGLTLERARAAAFASCRFCGLRGCGRVLRWCDPLLGVPHHQGAAADRGAILVCALSACLRGAGCAPRSGAPVTNHKKASRSLCPPFVLWALVDGLSGALTGPLIRCHLHQTGCCWCWCGSQTTERAQAAAGRVAVLTQRNRSPVAWPLVC